MAELDQVMGGEAARVKLRDADIDVDRRVGAARVAVGDLLELDAIKVRATTGALVYTVPGEGGDRRPAGPGESASGSNRLARLCAELLVTAESSANLVVLRTPPGAAQFLASSLDKADLGDVLGTIAGDETVVVISRAAAGGADLAQRFLSMAEQGRSNPDNESKDD